MKHQQKRKYTLRQRAAQQERTRERIVEATMALHEELGPRNTTISAIAERAGVQRLTVYRHFPDEHAVFTACTTRWLELNPPPQRALWQNEPAPQEQCRGALAAFYDYYRHTERMWHTAYRDLEAVPALQAPMAEFEAYLDQIRNGLLKGWVLTRLRRRDVAATLCHCLRFTTWRSLDEEGLNNKQKVDLAMRWLGAATEDSR